MLHGIAVRRAEIILELKSTQKLWLSELNRVNTTLESSGRDSDIDQNFTQVQSHLQRVGCTTAAGWINS